MKRLVVVLALGICGWTTSAAAQDPRSPRVVVSVNGSYQATANDFDDSTTFKANAEDGSFSGDYRLGAGPAFDIAGAVSVWRRMTVGVGVARFARSTPLTLTGSVPHPFFFNQPRSIAGTVSGLKREELLVNLQVGFGLPIARRLHAAVFGGPSFVQARQGIATDITWTDSYPYDEATFGSARTTTAKADKIGFNAGGDVTFLFTRRLGVGATVQYSGATVELPSAASTRSVKVGGVRFGGGLRLRF